MSPHSFSFREHRLLNVSQRQINEQYKTQNKNADTKGTRPGSNPNAALVEANVQTNFQEAGSGFGGKVLTSEEQKAHDAGMILADAGNYVKAPAQTPAAKAPVAPAEQKGGKLDESAINRLMESGGLSRAEAEARVQGMRTTVASTASNTGLGGSFDPAGQFVQVPTADTTSSAERVAAQNMRKEITDLSRPLRIDEVNPAYDPKGNMIKTAQQVLAEVNATRLQRATELQKQLSEMQTRQIEKTGAQTASTATAGLQGPQAPGAAVDPNAPQALPPSAVPPPGTPVAPGQPDMSGEDKAVADAKTQLDERLKNIDAVIPGAIDPAAAKADAKKQLEDQLDLADEQEKLAKERALEKERGDLAILDRSEQLQKIENTKAELDQIRFNTENEIKNRRRINKLSGGHDMSGLQWVGKQTQVGLDTLNYLREKAANMTGVNADKVLAVINNYGLELKQAEYDKKAAYAEDYSTYTTKLEDIRKELRLDNLKKMEMRDAAHKDYAKVLTDRDFKYGDRLFELQKRAQDRVWEVEKQAYERNRDLWTDVFKYIDTYGTQNKAQLTKFESELKLPAGSLSNQQTIEELRMRKTGGSGGEGLLTGETAMTWVDGQRQLLAQKYPSKSGEEIDKLVINLASYTYGSSRDGVKTVSGIAQYMTNNNFRRTVDPMVSALEASGYSTGSVSSYSNNPYAIIPERSPLVKIETGDGLSSEERAALGLD